MAIRCTQSSIEKDREGGDAHHLPVDGLLRLQLHHELVGRAILKVGYRSGHPVELDTHLMKEAIKVNQWHSDAISRVCGTDAHLRLAVGALRCAISGNQMQLMRTSALRSVSALPALSTKGTPSQRGVLMCTTPTANVSVVDALFEIVSSSRYPGCLPQRTY